MGREQARVKKAAEKAAKIALRKAHKEEKRQAKQIQNETKSIKQKQPDKGKKAAQLDSAIEINSGVGCDDEVVLGISRSGRMRKQPQYLQDYIL